ncbi:MAG: hypothetical protein MUC67_06340 [Acidobacteria bacterium]|jgi:hypothetical protein|nr:hypothetical protein [Acidobacteriota bacterium]
MSPNRIAAARWLALALVVQGTALAIEGVATVPSDPRQVPLAARMNYTRSSADLDGDGKPETLVIVTAITSAKEPAKGTEVVVGVIDGRAPADKGQLLWSRQIMAATGRPAHGGDVQAVDVDGDRRNELILTWDRSLSAEKVDRWGEIWVFDDLVRPRRVWEGQWEQDTRKDPDTPVASREFMKRTIDYGATRKAAGRAVVFQKSFGMTAGRALNPPRVVEERVDVGLRAP